jgi:hypothetical protein
MIEPFEDSQLDAKLDAMIELIEAGVPTELIIWATHLPYWLVEYTVATLTSKAEGSTPSQNSVTRCNRAEAGLGCPHSA